MSTTQLVRLLSKNSSTLLTGLSVAGLVTTPVLAVRATPEAVDLIEEANYKKHGIFYQKYAMSEEKISFNEWLDQNKFAPLTPLTKLEMLKLTWKCYIPAAVMGGITIACIIGAHKLHLRKQAALASACSLAAATLKEYQTKVIETIGATKNREIREEIHKDKLRKHPFSPNKEVIVMPPGKSLCYDVLSGRYFESDMETIRRVRNDLNRDLLNEMWIDLNSVYDGLGLPPIRLGAELGWSVHDGDIEFRISTQLAEDDRPCIVLDYEATPTADYQGR